MDVLIKLIQKHVYFHVQYVLMKLIQPNFVYGYHGQVIWGMPYVHFRTSLYLRILVPPLAPGMEVSFSWNPELNPLKQPQQASNLKPLSRKICQPLGGWTDNTAKSWEFLVLRFCQALSEQKVWYINRLESNKWNLNHSQLVPTTRKTKCLCWDSQCDLQTVSLS